MMTQDHNGPAQPKLTKILREDLRRGDWVDYLELEKIVSALRSPMSQAKASKPR